MTVAERVMLGRLLRRAPRYGINAAAVPLKPGIPTYIRITDIDNFGRFASSPKVGVAHSGAANYVLGPGELVFARTGASVGKSYLYDAADGQLVYAGFLINIAPDPKRLDPRFLALFVQTKEYWDWIARTSVRSGQPGVNGREYATLLVPLPDRATQNAVAETVSDVDRMIRSLERLLTKKQAIKQGLLQQLLTAQARLPGFSGRSWASHAFSDVMSRVNARKHKIPASAYSELGKLPVVDQGQKPIIGYTNDLDAAFTPGKGGVIVFGDHTCVTKFVDFNFAVGADGTQLIRAKENGSTRFFAYVLEHDPVISTGYNRHFKFLRKKILPMPSRAEQDAIVEVLTDADRELDVVRNRLRKARDIKAGMIQQLLTGCVRLSREIAS